MGKSAMQMSGMKPAGAGLQQKKYYLVAFIPAISLFLNCSSAVEV